MASTRHRPGRPLPYDALWRDPETGKQRAEAFRLKREAVAYGARMEAAKAEGRYVDPAGGQVTFRTYAESWRSSQVHRGGTVDRIRMNFENHVYPRLGHRPLAAVRRSEVQASGQGPHRDAVASHSGSRPQLGVQRVQGRPGRPAHPHVTLRRHQGCPRWNGPRSSPSMWPRWTTLAEGIDPRYRALIVLGAGSGVRIAEGLGLTADGVDFLRRSIHVDRQLVRTPGPVPVLRPVKDRKNRPRTIPVGVIVIDALAAHMAEFGIGPEGLLFTNVLGGKVGHTTWSDTWRAAAVASSPVMASTSCATCTRPRAK